jgi:hypothetical protein
MRLRSDRRRLPIHLATALPFEERERTLAWARCDHGCDLVATNHGLWEWPRKSPPMRHCWRSISDVRARGDRLSVTPAGDGPVACEHVLGTGEGFPDVVVALDAGSRLIDFAFTLPSGSRLRVEGRTCHLEGGISWVSRLDAAPRADAAADALATSTLIRRARSEYGMAGGTG